MDIVKLTESKIDLEEVVQSVSSSKCGATSIFIGTTRDNFQDKKVIRLEYEAYEPMALSEMKKVCMKIREKWNLEHICIVHRLGVVPSTESSIIIAISSPHRKESLEAVHDAINAVKSSVPIWKKEIYAEDEHDCSSSTWKANEECHWTAPEQSTKDFCS